MVRQLLITGYYKKQNTGDDLFENIATKLFSNNKNYKITIKSIDDVKNNIDTYYDDILLFGGETLNEYFLNPLAKIKEKNQNIKIYAMGVNLGVDIDYIKRYLIMFQYIIVRNSEDCEIIKKKFNNLIPCYYIQDIVFANFSNINAYKTKTIENTIGLFLSQPKLKNVEDIDNYINIINYFVNKKFTIKLFSMCYSNNKNESDVIINERIYNSLDNNIKKSVKIIPNNLFGRHIKTLKYAICERFHSHVLCINYNIPFISFANTNKVKQLLSDLSLNDLSIEEVTPDILYKKLKKINTKKLKNIYKKTNMDVELFYNKLMKYNLDDINIQFNYPKNKTKYYFNNDIINSQSNKVFNKYKTADDILMRLFGTTNLDYKWGLNEKIKNNLLTIEDIKWLYNESIYSHYYLHYKNITNNSNNNKIDIDYIDQYDRTNCHRSGWRYVVDNINNQLSTPNKDAIKCDLYVDRTFHWCCEEMVNNNIIPYTTPWIGIIHHTLYASNNENNYNCIELLKNKYFLESLKTCKSLIFLSKYLKDNFKKLADINNIILPPLFNLYHPTEFINNTWKYKNWKGNVIQVGSWMRDINAIYELKYNKKFALIGKNMEDKYICNSINIYKKTNDVKLIEYLDNNQYDEILSTNVVFIKLFDASAVNTLIECIVRNTPIIINKLPAVVEYLGEDYPLYYNSQRESYIDEVPRLLKTGLFKTNHIKKAHKYLKEMNKDFLKIETFINSLNKLTIVQFKNNSGNIVP
jgi:polysaccharide pyruvyl transferase WcaK-like protein